MSLVAIVSLGLLTAVAFVAVFIAGFLVGSLQPKKPDPRIQVARRFDSEIEKMRAEGKWLP